MVMFLVRHPMVFIFLNLFDFLECPVMLMTLILVIRFRQQNCSDKDIDIIKFVRRYVHSFNALVIQILMDCLQSFFKIPVP